MKMQIILKLTYGNFSFYWKFTVFIRMRVRVLLLQRYSFQDQMKELPDAKNDHKQYIYKVLNSEIIPNLFYLKCLSVKFNDCNTIVL